MQGQWSQLGPRFLRAGWAGAGLRHLAAALVQGVPRVVTSVQSLPSPLGAERPVLWEMPHGPRGAGTFLSWWRSG